MVADVLIAVVHCGDIADARDLTAVLIARGCVCGPHLLSWLDNIYIYINNCGTLHGLPSWQ